MRKTIVFILVALFVCGGLMLAGCKKKEAPTAETATAPTGATGITPPPGTGATGITPPPGTGTTAGAPTAEKPTAEKAPGK